jgi:ATP-dependent Clp protease ATP-binding subunit ClpC
VAKAIRRARSGLKDPKRPIGSFLFLGPTGVGKTELSKALAEFMFGDEDSMVRLDMSEFMERHEVSKLIGAPPGYVGYEEGGKLTEAVRRRPYAVILLDEIEKAHPDVFNILLQILEDGRLTDGQGRVVDFKNTVVIMTSNLGAQDLMKGPTIGFAASSENGIDFEEAKKSILDAVKRTFRPEFINRIDEIVVFKPLGEKELLQIVDLMIKDVAKRLAEKGLFVEVTDAAKEFLLKKGYEPKFGARPLRRAIQRYLEDRLADILLEGKIKPDSVIKVDVRDDDIIFIPVSGDEDKGLEKASSKQIV